jgi:hypothetical protein
MTKFKITPPPYPEIKIEDGKMYFVREKEGEGRTCVASVFTPSDRTNCFSVHYYMPDGNVLYSNLEYFEREHVILGLVNKVTFE